MTTATVEPKKTGTQLSQLEQLKKFTIVVATRVTSKASRSSSSGMRPRTKLISSHAEGTIFPSAGRSSGRAKQSGLSGAADPRT